jgi:hypothetical protein
MWLFRGIVGLTIAAAIVFGLIVAGVRYTNQRAQRSASEFCSAMPIGSEISVAAAEATRRKILWSTGSTYVFYFSGFFFDKGVCEVSVSEGGKVISKIARMEYD